MLKLNTCTHTHTNRYSHRHTQTDTDTRTETHTHTDTQTHTDRHTQTHTPTHRHTNLLTRLQKLLNGDHAIFVLVHFLPEWNRETVEYATLIPGRDSDGCLRGICNKHISISHHTLYRLHTCIWNRTNISNLYLTFWLFTKSECNNKEVMSRGSF
jgi:hypothetical protein